MQSNFLIQKYALQLQSMTQGTIEKLYLNKKLNNVISILEYGKGPPHPIHQLIATLLHLNIDDHVNAAKIVNVADHLNAADLLHHDHLNLVNHVNVVNHVNAVGQIHLADIVHVADHLNAADHLHPGHLNVADHLLLDPLQPVRLQPNDLNDKNN